MHMSRSSGPRSASRAISGSGCGGSPGSLASPQTDPRTRWPMQFSRWDAQGNVYLLTEQDLTADDVLASVGDADGILQVTARGGDWAEIVIWNPDGSTAELSGNGTRIAARWLARESGADEVVVRVGPREVRATMRGGLAVETVLGRVEVSEPETLEVGGETVELTSVSV